jgi:hypothetical protein
MRREPRTHDGLACATRPCLDRWMHGLAGAISVRPICRLGLLAGIVFGFPDVHAACEVDTPESSIAACEASYRQEVRKHLGDVGIVLTPAEESNLMALQRDQWSEAKASTRWEPAVDERRPAGIRPPPPSSAASKESLAGGARPVQPTRDPK